MRKFLFWLAPYIFGLAIGRMPHKIMVKENEQIK